MINLIYICLIIAFAIILKIIFGVNLKKMKELSKENPLDNLTARLPNNEEIGKDMLKILKNKSVKIEKSVDEKSQTSLYLITGNKIIIADNNKSFARVQTMAHECLHSIQSKKLLWFNFIFSNIYLVYFGVICILALLKILPMKMTFLSIFIVFSLVYYAVRTYLENDAMIKARFLAKEYMQEKAISTREEIDKIVNKYDELNDIGIRCTNFQLLSNVLLKIVILLAIFAIR